MAAISDFHDLQAQLDELRRVLEQNIIGQAEPIETILSALERYAAGLHDPKRPIGTFLFLGPTGVGKTFIVEELARLTQPEDAFIRIDCSEYSLEHEVARLLGAPPGYQGSEIGSHLTNKLKAMKHPDKGFILLLDEIEKAHPRFFDLWLQVFDSGRFTDSKGQTLDFSKALVFMTSNVGAGAYNTGKDMGFRDRPSAASVKGAVTLELKKVFRPEFLNRLTDVIHFSSLDFAQQQKIYKLLIQDLNKRLVAHDVRLDIGGRLTDTIFKFGFSKEYGARELKRTIIRYIEQPIAKKLVSGGITPDSHVTVDLDEAGQTTIHQIGAYPILMEEEAS